MNSVSMTCLNVDALQESEKMRGSEWIKIGIDTSAGKTAWPQSITYGTTIPGDSDLTVRTAVGELVNGGKRMPGTPPPSSPQKNRAFSPLPPQLSFFLHFFWGSSRGIWWCFWGRRGFTRQPENSKRAHFRAPGASNTTKIPRKDPQRERRKSENGAREGEKKSAKFWAPTLRAPTLRGPILRAPTMTHQIPKWIGPNWPNQDGQNGTGQNRSSSTMPHGAGALCPMRVLIRQMGGSCNMYEMCNHQRQLGSQLFKKRFVQS